jgi:hypothetical protein
MRRDFASLRILKMFQGMALLQTTIYPSQAILNIRGFPIPASGIPLPDLGESLPPIGRIPTRPARLARLKYIRKSRVKWLRNPRKLKIYLPRV